LNQPSNSNIGTAWKNVSENQNSSDEKPESWAAKQNFLSLMSIFYEYKFIQCKSLQACIENSNSQKFDVKVHPIFYSTRNKKGKTKEATIYAITLANDTSPDTVISISYASRDVGLNRSFSSLLKFIQQNLTQCSTKVQIIFIPQVLDEKLFDDISKKSEKKLLFTTGNNDLKVYSSNRFLKIMYLSEETSKSSLTPDKLTYLNWSKFLCSSKEKSFSE